MASRSGRSSLTLIPDMVLGDLTYLESGCSTECPVLMLDRLCSTRSAWILTESGIIALDPRVIPQLRPVLTPATLSGFQQVLQVALCVKASGSVQNVMVGIAGYGWKDVVAKVFYVVGTKSIVVTVERPLDVVHFSGEIMTSCTGHLGGPPPPAAPPLPSPSSLVPFLPSNQKKSFKQSCVS
ncbi:hypothetical protein EX30DRAFT_203831 [Ascodesmis nigricans]|uniref:Uncharacterized protein n=1 Tax=Ascodesmis nigricans TaxID=341454 RepID=A0A4S2MR91_9PEZI|nr:hypothetical protein EX30DRAFT_203831 [Ascodesmis nigricans]